nr:putative reverse transcriptase, RNA-dependent DNA polymerase, Gag-polypeptide of LTR copia-type [Tanacetum cinerariifolium]
MCDDFVKIMHDEFDMNMMGELNFFFGLQIKQLDDNIFFNQSKYIKEILEKFGLEDFKPMKTPMSSDTKLTMDEECESVDIIKYKGMIGSLLYLTTSRPDIMFSACLMHASKRIPKPLILKRICLTSWFSKKQTALAISTTEAEYVSAGKACQQALWMKQALIDYDIRLDNVPVIITSLREGWLVTRLSESSGNQLFFADGLGKSLSGTVKTEKAHAFAFVSKQSDMNRSRNNNWSNNGNNVNRGVYDSLLCKNCGLKGHTIDRCFELIGYPPGFKRNPNLKPNTNGNSKNNSGDFRKGSSNNSESKTSGNVSFTNEQFMKLMSLLNDKGSSAGQSNMAGANQHMTNSIKDMGLKNGRVLGTGSEFGGLYLFDKEYNKSTIANNSPCEVCHKAKQTRDSFPLSENKSPVFGLLMHLDVWGPYKVISMEGFRYFLTIVDDYSSDKKAYKLFSLGNRNVLYSRDVKFYETIFPYKMSVQLDVEQDVSESEVTNLKFFDCVKSDPKPKASISPDDDEEGSSCRDGSIYQSSPSHSLDQPEVDEQIPTSGSGPDLQGSGNDGLITATPIDENTKEVNPKKSSRTTNLPAKFNEYVLDNKVKYGHNRYTNHTYLDSQSRSFTSNLNKTLEPSSFEEASKDPNWISAMNDEMNALYENDTWYLVDLSFGRKPIRSKWVFKIKYKSDGEVDRFKARLVAKGFRQKEGLDYEKTFSPVVKMGNVRCLLSLAVQNEWDIYQMDINNAFLYGDLIEEVYMLPTPGFFDPSDKRHMHAPLKSHFDIALRLLKFLNLALGFGVQFVKRQSGFDIKAFSNSDWAKCPITRRSVSGYCVFVNGCLVFWQSKKQVTLSRSLAEAEYRSMAAATCEIMWIVKIISDLNIRNLLPAELYCYNKAAIQIAANPVMYEKTKHFDLDVHFIREKVCTGLIKTVKVESKDNVADILTKALGSFQHDFLTKKFGMINLFGS